MIEAAIPIQDSLPVAGNDNLETRDSEPKDSLTKDQIVAALESSYRACFDLVWRDMKAEQITENSIERLQLAQSLLIHSPNGDEARKFSHLVRLVALQVPDGDIPRAVYKDFAMALESKVGQNFVRIIHLELFRCRVQNFLGTRKDLA